MTDPIADLLTRVRNGQMARKERVEVPYSKLKFELLGVMAKKGFINGYKQDKSGKFPVIQVDLNSIKKLVLKRASKPGQRIYIGRDEIKKVLNGYGISILSTSKGLMTGDEARKQGVGGELLCEIY